MLSTVIPALTSNAPDNVKLPLASNTVALLAGKQQNTVFVPEEKSTALSLLELDKIVVRARVELSEDKVPKPTSNSAFSTIQ